ncbi:glucosamine-6-phosphate deaminase [Pontibacillus litoralis]|uniref:Glucosamine-6-phosphate deaminase n=1 Tax=Pontibacillus litoralis JSM 072002 TaxID=1385512 RepID=A0A0A5G4Y4_9BACI|nr:glucosamine-6-phosphate deaminase [Pontibacillus litoralis]KGX88181.1 glucosamine-6-phosphate deaminase [Pontibacillus litoralis JSM 072002]
MEIVVKENYEALSNYVAQCIQEQIKDKPSSVIGLATGSTPVGTYKELVEAYKRKEVDFSKISTINLDEYIGLSNDHPQSYHVFMQEQLFNHVNIEEQNTHIPNGVATNLEEECQRYEQVIDTIGPVDLQILGIGVNGHIGFNEPGSSFTGKTSIVPLTESTIEANARFFDTMEEVPREAVTMGIQSILKSKKIILLASGESKAPVIEQLLSGEVTEALPASVLHQHEDVTIVVDPLAYQLVNK